MSETADPDAYGGLPGAFPYAFRRSRSLLFKLYVVIGTLLALAIAVLFSLALIVLVANTAGTSASLSLSRSFFVLVGLLVVLPIVAPILFVARRIRRGAAADGRYERRLALSGFAFIGAIYLALLVSIPPEQQPPIDGSVAPVVETLYALPSVAAVVPLSITAALIYVVHRFSR